ncbi:unnamed protein product [Linum trigynum]|uniref:Uncharacterized protein n=1 Tax=Linum trigynum TaxID=586398 RepID=A0AAV2D0Q6_9ROSI
MYLNRDSGCCCSLLDSGCEEKWDVERFAAPEELKRLADEGQPHGTWRESALIAFWVPPSVHPLPYSYDHPP